MKINMTIEINRNQENAIESFLRQFDHTEEDICVGTFIKECCWAGGLEDMHSRVESFAKRDIGYMSFSYKIYEVA